MAAFLLPLAAGAVLRFGVRKGAELLAKRKAKKLVKYRIREEEKKRSLKQDLVKIRRKSRKVDKQMKKSGGRVRKHLNEQSKALKEFIKEAPKIKQSIIDSAEKAKDEIRKIKLDK